LYETQVRREVKQLVASNWAHGSVDAIRDVIIARRQWEILADELGKPTATGFAGEGLLHPERAVQKAAAHDVGRETLTSNKHRDTVEAFQSLSDAAARAIVWNTRTSGTGPDGALREPDVIEKAGLWLSRGVRWGGRVGASWMFAPDMGKEVMGVAKSRWLIILGALVVVGMLVWALLLSWWAVVLTTVALLVVFGVAIRAIIKMRGKPRAPS
jgi:hypothetical protein